MYWEKKPLVDLCETSGSRRQSEWVEVGMLPGQWFQHRGSQLSGTACRSRRRNCVECLAGRCGRDRFPVGSSSHIWMRFKKEDKELQQFISITWQSYLFIYFSCSWMKYLYVLWKCKHIQTFTELIFHEYQSKIQHDSQETNDKRYLPLITCSC